MLTAPGTADLTADVDFSYLQRMAQERVATLGPIKQQDFLKNMGIDIRLQVEATVCHRGIKASFTELNCFTFRISVTNLYWNSH